MLSFYLWKEEHRLGAKLGDWGEYGQTGYKRVLFYKFQIGTDPT